MSWRPALAKGRQPATPTGASAEQRDRLRGLALGLYGRVVLGERALLPAYLATEAQLRQCVEAPPGTTGNEPAPGHDVGLALLNARSLRGEASAPPPPPPDPLRPWALLDEQERRLSALVGAYFARVLAADASALALYLSVERELRRTLEARAELGPDPDAPAPAKGTSKFMQRFSARATAGRVDGQKPCGPERPTSHPPWLKPAGSS